jgi:hypothetical protein
MNKHWALINLKKKNFLQMTVRIIRLFGIF